MKTNQWSNKIVEYIKIKYRDFRLYFTTRRQLIDWVNWQADQSQILKDAVRTCRSWEDLERYLHPSHWEQPVLLPGSDIGVGKLNISHWASSLFAVSFMDCLEAIQAPNFVELKFNPVIYKSSDGIKITDYIIVTIQRAHGLTPVDKIKFLEKEIEELKKQKNE